MPSVKVDFRNAGDGGGNYATVPPGNYLLRCIVSKVQKNQSGPGNVIWTEWRIRGPEHAGGKILQVFSLAPNAAWNLRNMMMAISGKEVPKSLLNINTDSFLNQDCGAFISEDEFTNRQQKKQKTSKVTEWMTVTAYEALRTPSRGGAPTAQQAVAEAETLEDDEKADEFEYEDPEAEDDEGEEAEEFKL